MSVSAVCSSTNLKFGKAPSCGEKRAGCFCVCVSKHEDIFAHALARVHGDIMEKGRNVTDRVRQEEEEESSISSSSLYFTLLLLCRKKRRTIKQRYLKQLCRREQKPTWEDKGLPQSALKSQAQKASRKTTAVSCCFRAQHLSGSVSEVTEIEILPSSLASPTASSFFCPPFPPLQTSSFSFSLIFSPSCWFEYSYSTESIRLD